MKVKNIKLEIRSEDEVIEEAKSVMNKLSKGINVKTKSVISFDSIDVMRKFITDERLRILKTVKKHRPSSIYALAKILERDTKNVTNDVNYLEEIGLIEIKKTKTGRVRSIPSINYDKILLEILV
ncbi:MAG: HVO_A0114 family putative DNA-binding protein [Candidatus Anammoxibacter sp.]